MRRIGVFEGVDKNLHYHMLLESPKHVVDVLFEHKVENLWGSVRSVVRPTFGLGQLVYSYLQNGTGVFQRVVGIHR